MLMKTWGTLGAVAATSLAGQLPFATLDVQLTNNHVYVPAIVANRAVWLLVDTGAATTLLSLRTAKELALPLGQSFEARGAGAGTMEGSILQQPARLNLSGNQTELSLEVRAALALDALEPHEGRRIDGILGSDFLSRFVTEIDYERARLHFHNTQSFAYRGGGTRVPIEIRQGHPHLTAAVVTSNGEIAGDFVIDVGSSLGVSLTKPFVTKLSLDTLTPMIPTLVGRGVGGAAQASVARLEGLRIGELRLPQIPAVLFGDGGGVMTTGEFFEGNIGGDILRRFTVFLDFARKEIILEPNGRIRAAFRVDLSGVALRTEIRPQARKFVNGIATGSAGFVAGLMPDDELLEVDGQSVESVPLDDLRDLFRASGRRFELLINRNGTKHKLTMATASF